MKKAIKDLFRNGESEIKPLNGLRAFAILFVLVNHYYINLKSIIAPYPTLELLYSNLWSGVDLFFVLSGFLISKGLWENWKVDTKLDFKKFYIKRTLRIFPAYYLFLTITYLTGKIMIFSYERNRILNEAVENLQKAIGNSWADFVFLGNYLQGIHTHTWSLSTEEQFYLIFPILCATIFFKFEFKVRQFLLLLVYLLPVLFRILILSKIEGFSNPPYYEEIYHPFQTRFDSLIIGVIAMDIYMNKENWSNEIKDNVVYFYSLLLLFFSFLIFSHLQSQYDPNFFRHTFKYNVQNIGFAGILYLSIIKIESPISKFLSLNVFSPIAKLSYTIYLWHFIIMGVSMALFKINAKTSIFEFHLKFLAMLVLQVILTLPLYIFIELPFQKLRKKFYNENNKS
ncbi:acyltransferase [Leptospira congkakensis]|uniref:Acyltransferase n=1 Tax=Leptospira congkakensis TaxID=2484932 RepID=A0A4Z1AH90_9LEPT|nr:acyltransferase [Leptospira congkakensis]TGL87677.1 acyltransferase [Leptospira congkakensis]TGL89707.1 acyltransferase [Leptospira congkakensis]TGL95827.1 acyltransferase [Leptospira congkakensis]